MESDSDHFESADEEFECDDQQDRINKNVHAGDTVNVNEPTLEVKNISLEGNDVATGKEVSLNKDKISNDNDRLNVDKLEEPERCVNDISNESKSRSESPHLVDKSKDESNITVAQSEVKTTEKLKPRERKERPQRTKEPKTKLGLKLGTKFNTNKSKATREMSEESITQSNKSDTQSRSQENVIEVKTTKQVESQEELSGWEDEDWAQLSEPSRMTQENITKVKTTKQVEQEEELSGWGDDDWTQPSKLTQEKITELKTTKQVEPQEESSGWGNDEDRTQPSKITQEKITVSKITKQVEPQEELSGWEDDVDWTPLDEDTKPQTSAKTPNLYSEKSKLTTEKNFWDNEADYMELPRQKKKETVHPVLDKLSTAINEDQSSGWGGWGSWGVSSILSSATLGVSTLTNSVSQGITTVLESGIGAPDPEELARMHKYEKEKNTETDTSETVQNNPQIGFGLGNFVSGVTHITKLVETTGTKVLTGGLDTLEVIGKKTMEVLQEGDPGLKKKRAMLGIDQDKPVLSQILREAKERAEEENKLSEERYVAKKVHYETLFDDHQGLVHLEALEMLSKQCDIKLETLTESSTGSELVDMQETMAQIKELCELPDEDEDNDTSDTETVREKIESAVSDLNIKITYDNFLKTWTDIDIYLQDDATITDENEVHQKAIENLAQMTAIAVEQFHKAAELLLIKERRSTVDEADSLVQLTIILTSVIGVVAGKFSEKLNTLANGSTNSDNVNSLITNIFLEAANSSSYIQDAFNLMIPILQVGAV